MLKLKNISVKLGDFNLRNINLELKKGDYFVLLGKSGVGKSVLLEIIAGLIQQDKGEIFLNNENISKEKIQNRKVGIVFQDYSIFPHLSVKQNIEYSLKSKKVSSYEKIFLVNKYAKLTEIDKLLNRNIQKLSGGELQRVALARMLVSQPDCLLLDEPLASLDVQLKHGIRNLLRQINQSGVTILHVTHDYEEAIALSNKIAVMHEGEIIQKGFTPDVFQKPANKFVADFTGVKNFFNVEFKDTNKAIISENLVVKVSNKENLEKGKIIIRREDITLSTSRINSIATNNFEGVIKQIIPYLSNYEIIVNIGLDLNVIISEESQQKFQFQENEKVYLSFKSTDVKIIS